MAAAKKQKWYVVWTGNSPGIYTTWDEAKKQIHGVAGAQYKSYESHSEAKEAFETGPVRLAAKRPTPTVRGCILPSFAVDAACDMTTGVMEYRGVDVETGAEIFRMGPYLDSSNNLGEFLAIVHGLALLKQKGFDMPIYSDSVNAINWIKQKKCKTKLPRDAKTTVHVDERFAGRFRRVVSLPDDIDPNAVSAAYTDGVLHVSVKRRQRAQPRRIEVQ